MRRLLAAGIVLAVGIVGGASPSGASIITGTEGADQLTGTRSTDVINGLGGNDRIDGLAGDDVLIGGTGSDRITGGGGNDRIGVHADAASDTVACGAGQDLVNAELDDVVLADCEVLSRQLSRDPYTNFDAQHETQVEPDSFSFGQTIVTTFQSGRFTGGGAANIGWATSRDAGLTWRAGHLPGQSIFSTPAGSGTLVSDPVVAYDARHGQWLIATLGRSGAATELLISRSRDGLAWSLPIVAAHDPDDTIDKEWITCDNWTASPYRGRCYMSYLADEPGRIVTQSSNDGGLTWSAQVAGPPPTSGVVNGAQPVAQPSGALLVIYSTFAGAAVVDDQITAIRSTNGGATFGPARRVSSLQTEDIAGLRAPSLASAEVDRAGRVYVAWSDCRFRSECSANDIVLSRSLDGLTWTAPIRVPTGPIGANPDFWVPGLGIDATTAGAKGRIAVAFHSSPLNCGYFDACAGVDVGLVISRNGGRNWTRPLRLNVETMPLPWLANTGLGRFTGDYISTSWVGGKAIPVFSLAAEPDFEGNFKQAIFAMIGPGTAMRRR